MTAAADCGKFDTDVVIVGAGPVGTLLAILLGQRGKLSLVLSRTRSIWLTSRLA